MIFRSFGSRNFRLFFIGQSISMMGFWLQQIAVSWLVYRLTASPLLLGVAGFLDKIPMLLLGPFAGVLVDRWNRHRTVMVTQTLAMIQAFILAGLTLSGHIQVWHIFTLGFIQGTIFCLDIPARQSLFVEMVNDRGDLSNAIALNSTLVHSARMVGPPLAGFLIAFVGEGYCFLVNAVTYLAVIAALFAMQLKPREKRQGVAKVLHELKEGFSYAYGNPGLRALLLLISLVSITGMPYVVLMPIFSSEVLQGGPRTLGLLMGAAGAGGLTGAVYLASRTNIQSLPRLISVVSALSGGLLMAFSLSTNLPLSLALIALAGFGLMVQMIGSNTVIQTIVEDSMRGRVMSYFSLSFLGVLPFGNLAAGFLAHQFGAPATLLVGGFLCTLSALAFGRKVGRLAVEG